MSAERLDIVERPGGWLLSDMRGKPRYYLSSSEALAVAVEQARRTITQGTAVEVHLWRNGQDTEVFVGRDTAPAPKR